MFFAFYYFVSRLPGCVIYYFVGSTMSGYSSTSSAIVITIIIDTIIITMPMTDLNIVFIHENPLNCFSGRRIIPCGTSM